MKFNNETLIEYCDLNNINLLKFLKKLSFIILKIFFKSKKKIILI